MLAVDNFSYSSKVASAFRSIFATTLQGRTSAPTISISVVRTMPPALVSCKGSLLITTHAVDVHLTRTPPFVHRTSRAPTLGVVSPSSRSSAQGSRISAFATWHMKEVLGAVRCKPVRGCRPSFRRVWRTSITNSIRLLVNRTWTVCLCGVAGPQAIGKEYILLFLEILYAPPSSFPYVSLYINWNLSLSLTDSIYTSVQRPLTTEKSSPSIATVASGSIGTSFIGIRHFGKHTERRVCDLTGVHISLWCKSKLLSLTMIGCRGASMD